MKKLIILFTILLIASDLSAGGGKTKLSEVSGEKKPDIIVESPREVDRYCGWSQSSHPYVIGGSDFNAGIFYTGLGVWGNYRRSPEHVSVSEMAFTCSPKPFKDAAFGSQKMGGE